MESKAQNSTTNEINNQLSVVDKPKSDLVLNWINTSKFDNDNESIISESTAVSSSIVESDDHDFDFASLNLQGASKSPSSGFKEFKNVNNNASIANRFDQQYAFVSKDSSIQTVGNVQIQNSQQVHIGNITHINISNPTPDLMETIFKKDLKSRPVNVQNTSSVQRKKNDVMEHEEAKREDAFLGDIKPRIAEHILPIIQRRMWLAQTPMDAYEYLSEPAKYVIISHSATEMATTQADNIYLIRHIQCFHVESCKWNDIAYNFLIGCDGNVYVGRGWGVVGAHAIGYNVCSVGISFVGCFMRELPPAISLQSCQKLIQMGVEKGHIAHDYKLLGHCQCNTTQSPGRKLYEEIQTWPHYSPHS